MLHIDYQMFKVEENDYHSYVGNVLPQNLDVAVEELVGVINGDKTGMSICHPKDDVKVVLSHITGITSDYYEMVFYKNNEVVPCSKIVESTIDDLKRKLTAMAYFIENMMVS